MRSRLSDLFRQISTAITPSKRRRPPTKSHPTGAPTGHRPAADTDLAGTVVAYEPCRDGDPDPGEVVWTWVPYEDDPQQGKDRPVVVFGRRGSSLIAVALTSKEHDNEPQFAVGTGPWDRDGRPSFAKLDRILDVQPDAVRREGSALPRDRFDALVDAIRRAHRMERR